MSISRCAGLLLLVLPVCSTGCATQALWEEFDEVTADSREVVTPISPARLTRAARCPDGGLLLEVAYADGQRRTWAWAGQPRSLEPAAPGPRCEPEEEAPPLLRAAGELPPLCPDGWVQLEVLEGEDWPEPGAPAPLDPEAARPCFRLGAGGLLEERDPSGVWSAVARVPSLERRSSEEAGVDVGDVALGVVWVGLTPVTVAVDAVIVGGAVGLIGLIVPLVLL